ncbi:MAG TPA: FHA domain-containing protein [Gemmatimonadales bacterium]
MPLTIGREPSSNVPVHSAEVSRSHAYILRTPQGFLLVDSSLHGTYVNGERVQAQRLLADGDLVQIGAESFRFALRSADPPSDAGPMPGGAPETSQYARVLPLGAGATGKLRLALALAERGSWKSRVRTWVKRYGPSEAAGIGMALGVSWLVQQSTGNVIAAAYGASIGEALGFYGSLVIREMIQEAYHAGARRAPYGVSEMIRTWRGLFLEFGPAELLDTGLVRALAMALCTRLLGWGLGIVAGKVLADVLFYLPVIWVYEHRRRQTT